MHGAETVGRMLRELYNESVEDKATSRGDVLTVLRGFTSHTSIALQAEVAREVGSKILVPRAESGGGNGRFASRRPVGGQGRATCYAHNRPEGCATAHCNYEHVCNRCKKPGHKIGECGLPRAADVNGYRR